MLKNILVRRNNIKKLEWTDLEYEIWIGKKVNQLWSSVWSGPIIDQQARQIVCHLWPEIIHQDHHSLLEWNILFLKVLIINFSKFSLIIMLTCSLSYQTYWRMYVRKKWYVEVYSCQQIMKVIEKQVFWWNNDFSFLDGPFDETDLHEAVVEAP